MDEKENNCETNFREVSKNSAPQSRRGPVKKHAKQFANQGW